MERGIVVGGALLGASLVLAVVFNDIANRNAASTNTPSVEPQAETDPAQTPLDVNAGAQLACDRIEATCES